MEDRCFIQCDTAYRQLKASWDSWAFFLNGYPRLLVGEEPWSALPEEAATSPRSLLSSQFEKSMA